jgi:hypothetical protein
MVMQYPPGFTCCYKVVCLRSGSDKVGIFQLQVVRKVLSIGMLYCDAQRSKYTVESISNTYKKVDRTEMEHKMNELIVVLGNVSNT